MMEVQRKSQKAYLYNKCPEAFLASITSSTGDAITAIDTNGEIVYWNRAAEELFGYRAEEIIGEHIFKIVPVERRKELEIIWEKVNKNGFIKAFETERLAKNGDKIPVEVTISVIKDGKSIIGYSAIFHDIRKRKEIEKKLIELSNFNKKIIQNAPVGILAIDRHGKVTCVNPKLLNIFSHSEHAVLGLNVFELPINNEIREFFKMVLEEGKEVQLEGEYTPPWGSKAYFVMKCVPLLDDQGKIEGALAIIEDITEKKKLEKELIESHEKLKKAYMELKSLDELKSNIIANVSHELKTPITLIKGFIELALLEKDEKKRNTFLIKAKEAVMRQNSIVDDLISISRVERGEFRLTIQKFDLVSVIEECIRRKKNFALRRNIEIIKEIKEPCFVKGDKIEIMLVILNLLDNAIKFNKKNGKVTIKVEKENDTAKVSVIDTGVGIPRDKINDIFKPLTQLDPKATRKYGGTGTGLAVAKKIIEMHGSKIKVKSEMGKGSEFYFMLPLASLGP